MPSEEDPIPAKRIRLDIDEVNETIENEKKPGTTYNPNLTLDYNLNITHVFV